MKKRAFAFVAALTMVLTVAVYFGMNGSNVLGNEKTAYRSVYQQYLDACVKLEEAGSYTMDAISSITITIPNEDPLTIDVPMNVKIVTGGTEAKLELNSTMDIGMGGPVEMKMVYIDNVFYIDSMGSKVKMPFSVEDALGQVAEAGIPGIDEQFVKEQHIENGVLKFTIDGACMTDLAGSQFNNLVDIFNAAGVIYDDIDCEVRLNNGVIAGIKMDMGLSMDVVGENAKVHAFMDYAVSAVGATTVDKPVDADVYVEMEPSLLY